MDSALKAFSPLFAVIKCYQRKLYNIAMRHGDVLRLSVMCMKISWTEDRLLVVVLLTAVLT